MDDKYERVYVWELPVRLTHWLNMLCIITLSITGYYIGNPFIHAVTSREYIMGWIRFIHFVVAYTFLMSIIVRIYWLFMGNKYAGFREWIPLTIDRWRELLGGIKFYLFINRKVPSKVGHTVLAGLTYTLLYLLFLFEVVSGFAMYSVNHSGMIWTFMGGWLVFLMHLQTIRLYHHLVMYLIIAIAVIHVYVAWYLDTWEKNGLMDSIFSGFKFRINGK
jgi:Ni/Fe-hydrogenase 1 B-type cytochrome subunit